MPTLDTQRLDFRVGADTPLGLALRRYWTPVCMSSDVAEPDCDPIRVWVLGQSYVVFRDTAGRVGVIDEACPHRKASLVFGRNEEGGIRCLWHQWKIATDGALLETPNNPDGGFRERVKANAYDVVESGGLIWGYFGPAELKPPFPEFQWAGLPPENVLIIPVDLDCNFVRPLEGLVDTSHVALLHADAVKRLSREFGAGDGAALNADSMPHLELELTDFGFHYAAIRNLPSDTDAAQVRMTAYAAPYACFISPGDHAHISVPQDDTHTRLYNVMWSRDQRLDAGEAPDRLIAMYGLTDEILDRQGIRATMPPPGPLGRRNHFVQDRDAMRSGETFTGHLGLTAEDAVMTVTIGSISDYRGEHLTPADLGVVRLRRAVNDIATSVAAGREPVGLRPRTDTRRIGAPSGVLAAGADWRLLVPDHARLDKTA